MQRADKPATMKMGGDNKEAKQVTRCKCKMARNTGGNGKSKWLHSSGTKSHNKAKYHERLNTPNGRNQRNSKRNAIPTPEK
jgi:hypothetical protein